MIVTLIVGIVCLNVGFAAGYVLRARLQRAQDDEEFSRGWH